MKNEGKLDEENEQREREREREREKNKARQDVGGKKKEIRIKKQMLKKKRGKERK